jgi:hypothetical protein
MLPPNGTHPVRSPRRMSPPRWRGFSWTLCDGARMALSDGECRTPAWRAGKRGIPIPIKQITQALLPRRCSIIEMMFPDGFERQRVGPMPGIQRGLPGRIGVGHRQRLGFSGDYTGKPPTSDQDKKKCQISQESPPGRLDQGTFRVCSKITLVISPGSGYVFSNSFSNNSMER